MGQFFDYLKVSLRKDTDIAVYMLWRRLAGDREKALEPVVARLMDEGKSFGRALADSLEVS